MGLSRGTGLSIGHGLAVGAHGLWNGASGLLDGSGGSALNYSFTNGTLPSGVTLTRASAGSYTTVGGLVASAGVNAARFDYDPITHAANGILVEPARTNAVWPSSSFTSVWVAAGSLATDNATTSPSGAGDGGLMSVTATGTAGFGFYYAQAIAVGDSIALYLKKGTTNYAGVGGNTAGDYYAYFNLNTGVVGNTFGCTAAIQDCGAGWYRCTLTNVTSGSSYICISAPDTMAAVLPWTSATTSGNSAYIWGVQHEVGTTATTYIATVGAGATRSADALSFTIPAGVATLRYTFDNATTQDVSVSPGAYTVPTNLNRARIVSILGL